jgi:formylglycine-generating enzyme required for sulfatase activity
VSPFALDTAEVTNREFIGVFGALPEHNDEVDVPSGGDHPVVFVTHDLAMTYAERVGKRLPWEREYEYAASLGGTTPLLTREDLHSEDRRGEWFFGEVRRYDELDRLWENPAILGLLSNVSEWTLDWPLPYADVPKALLPRRLEETRVYRGGSYRTCLRKQPGKRDLTTPRTRDSVETTSKLPGLGFRSARSLRPQYLDDLR